MNFRYCKHHVPDKYCIHKECRRRASRSLKRVVKPLVVCHHCQGRGKIPMSEELWEALHHVRHFKSATAQDVANALAWNGHVTAMNNRLEDLMNLGLLKRRKDGRQWRYEAA